MKALKEAVRSRDEFISICSHELKTPITSMLLQAEITRKQIEEGDERFFNPEILKKRSEAMTRQLGRMTKLIEDMLDVTRLSDGKMSLNKTLNDLNVIVSDVINNLEGQINSQNIKVNFALPEDSNFVEFDPYWIEQVISNLMTNAIKYGEGKPIDARIESTQDSVILRVQDQGQGISKDNLERIFGRFERADSSNNISGLGLGLYISKQIILEHGGELKVESTPGIGSIFSMILPK